MLKFNERSLRKLYCYIKGENSLKETHSANVEDEYNALQKVLDECLEEPEKTDVFNKAMDMAVEFEEDGFVKGFMTAMDFFAEE